METIASPLVSVIVPAYNHEKYVQQTLQSILAQTYANLELLILDDGSRDQTYAKIKEMLPACEARCKRVWIHSRPNRGVCESINELLAQAQGESIALIASDDAYAPGAIEAMVRAFLSPGNEDLVLVVGKNIWMDGEGKPLTRKFNIAGEAYETNSFSDWLIWDYAKNVQNVSLDKFYGTYKALIYKNHIPNGYLIKGTALRAIGPFTREAPLEDYWMMLNLAQKGRFLRLETHTFWYRWHESNTVKCIKVMKHNYRLMERWIFRQWLSLPQSEQARLLPEGLSVLGRRRILPGILEVVYVSPFTACAILKVGPWQYPFILRQGLRTLLHLPKKVRSF